MRFWLVFGELVYVYFQPWMQSAHQLLDFLVSREDATPFRHPVDLNDFPVSYARFRRRTSHELNRMLIRENKRFFSFAFDSVHVMFGV